MLVVEQIAEKVVERAFERVELARYPGLIRIVAEVDVGELGIDEVDGVVDARRDEQGQLRRCLEGEDGR